MTRTPRIIGPTPPRCVTSAGSQVVSRGQGFAHLATDKPTQTGLPQTFSFLRRPCSPMGRLYKRQPEPGAEARQSARRCWTWPDPHISARRGALQAATGRTASSDRNDPGAATRIRTQTSGGLISTLHSGELRRSLPGARQRRRIEHRSASLDPAG